LSRLVGRALVAARLCQTGQNPMSIFAARKGADSI
jgi:hypothetical protein